MAVQYFRFIHTADWHFWDKHKYSVNGSRLKQLFGNALRIVQFAIKNKVDVIFISGDLVHVYNPDEKILVHLTKIFKIAIKNGIKIRIINGNHDTNGLSHSLESIQNVVSSYDQDMIKIFTFKKDGRPCANKEFFTKQIGEGISNILQISIAYIPYQKDIVSAIKTVNKTACFNNFDKNIIVAHGGINGAYTSSGKKLKTNITLDLFEDWDYGALGDYHKWQKLSDGIYYSGSIIKINRNEKNDQKSFNYVTIEKEEHKKSIMKVERINLPDIELIDLKVKYEKLKDDYKKISKIGDKKVKDAIINIFIYGDIGTGEKIVKLKIALYAGGAAEVYPRFINNNFSSIRNSSKKMKSKIKLALDAGDACVKFAESKKMNQQYIDYGLNKINSVR